MGICSETGQKKIAMIKTIYNLKYGYKEMLCVL